MPLNITGINLIILVFQISLDRLDYKGYKTFEIVLYFINLFLSNR